MPMPTQAPPVKRTQPQSWCHPPCPIPLGTSRWRVYWNGQPSEILTVVRKGVLVDIMGPFWHGGGTVYFHLQWWHYIGDAHLRSSPGQVARHIATLSSGTSLLNPATADVVVAWPDGKLAKSLEWRLIEET